jgi:hypothetical protein
VYVLCLVPIFTFKSANPVGGILDSALRRL